MSALPDPVQKENNSVKSAIKVYSRIKNKKVPAKDVLPIKEDDFLGDFLLGSDSNLEGDSHLRSRPDDTSPSSSSDSEESYFSEKIIEKDLDFQLEGMTRLFDDSESTKELFQPAMPHDNTVIPNDSVPQLKGSSPPSEGKEDADKMSYCLETEGSSSNESQLKGNRRLEWKNAQALLSQLGIKLIHDTKKIETEETATKQGGELVIGNYKT